MSTRNWLDLGTLGSQPIYSTCFFSGHRVICKVYKTMGFSQVLQMVKLSYTKSVAGLLKGTF